MQRDDDDDDDVIVAGKCACVYITHSGRLWLTVFCLARILEYEPTVATRRPPFCYCAARILKIKFSFRKVARLLYVSCDVSRISLEITQTAR